MVAAVPVRASELWEKCYRCHKETGRSYVDEVITLSGQNKQYLVNQLYAFKLGERKEVMLRVMNRIAASLTDEEIEKLAEHYSKQDPRPLFTTPPPATKIDKEMYARGAAHAQVCLSCHADAETRPAKRPDWPYISGQNFPALLIQLRAFSTGDRANPMMAFIQSQPFNDPKVQEDIAYYFSVQLPPGPEGAGPWPPPRSKPKPAPRRAR